MFSHIKNLLKTIYITASRWLTMVTCVSLSQVSERRRLFASL